MFLIFALDVHAVKLSETMIQTIKVPTAQTFQNEKDALEATFSLEDQIQNHGSSEYKKLRKNCEHFIRLLTPTIVRLEVDEYQNIKGVVHAKIRCMR